MAEISFSNYVLIFSWEFVTRAKEVHHLGEGVYIKYVLYLITYIISFACCRSNNPTLLQLLLSLKDANEDNSHHQQIVLATLKACPDLVISYLNGVSYTFEPKLSSKWMSNIDFILQVLLCVHLYVQMCVPLV